MIDVPISNWLIIITGFVIALTILICLCKFCYFLIIKIKDKIKSKKGVN